MKIDDIIKKLNIEPLDIEGGYFRRTYTSDDEFHDGQKIGSAIYYVITDDSFSALHKLKNSDEMFHFYAGDPVEMMNLYEDGTGEIVTITNQLGKDFYPQHLVRKNVWQGARLKSGGKFAIFGVTVFPEFLYDDFVIGDADELIRKYPEFEREISELT